jgi:hypothetical protein
MNPHADIDSVPADFPLLRSGEFSLTKNMDGLIREIIQVLERCSKPEKTVSDEERADNEYLVNRILDADMAIDLSIEADKDEGHKALLLLFRKRIASPDNLEMLIRMVDTDVQAGKIRCFAFLILVTLVHDVDYVWGLKMKDSSYFATAYLVACCKTLEDETNEDSNNHHTERFCECSCARIATMYLTRAISMTKDTPAKVIERVHSSTGRRYCRKRTKSKSKQTDDSSVYTICAWTF